jgi:hypothetical protein
MPLSTFSPFFLLPSALAHPTPGLYQTLYRTIYNRHRHHICALCVIVVRIACEVLHWYQRQAVFTLSLRSRL